MTIDLQHCWTVSCRGCGKALEGGPEDERWTMIFFTRGYALETATDCEWTTDGNVCWCPDCSPSRRLGATEVSLVESDQYRLFCDQCCEEFEDSEGERIVFSSLAKAYEAALPEGWTTDGRRWYCAGCSEGEPIGEGTTWVHIPIPGQEVLDV